MLDQVTAGADSGAQRQRGRGGAGQRGETATVGTDHVGQHVGVEPVVLVAGRSVTRAQILDLVRADHQHGKPGLKQRLYHRTVAAFDPDFGHAGDQETAGQLLQPGGGVGDAEPVNDLTVWSKDADDVVVLGPVDTGTHSRWQDDRSDTHGCFLAVRAVSKHPVVLGLRSRSLIDRRSPAHSPVAGLGVLGHRAPQNSRWTSQVERPLAMARWGPGVHQQPIWNCRPKDGAPMSTNFARGG